MRRGVLTLVALLITMATSAKITMAPLFKDNMVLQQQSDVAIWGYATPKSDVYITMSWGCDEVIAKADKSGRWSATITTPRADGAYSSLYISDGDIHTINNVLLGEVWLCSGQSNMEMPMTGFARMPTAGATDYIMRADKERPIRICTVGRGTSRTPLAECEAEWVEHTPQGVAGCSATAYFFADYLQSILDVPVGIIITSWGGTPIEPWMDEATLKEFEGEVSLEHLKGKGEYKNGDHRLGAMLYNAMVAPLVPYTVKGLLWYQGEANRTNPELYPRLMEAYAGMMREKWGNEKMPYYYVQIAPYKYSGEQGVDGALLREAQSKALEMIPYSGMVSTLDLGEANNIHPGKKQPVGQRLAYLALVNDYGMDFIEPRSPKYQSHTIQGDKVTIKFDAGRSDIALVDGEIRGFEVAGEDREFHPATSIEIKPNAVVVVSAEGVEKPVAVRYAFRNEIDANLYSRYGIPVDQFRTDSW